MKILLSGGHLTPALAFIDYVQLSHKKDKLIFVGRLFNKAGEEQESQEKTEVERRNVPFIPFSSGKLHNRNTLQQLQQVLIFGVSLFTAYRIISREKPTVFLSFGGYLAVPLAFICSWKKIPIVTHEQTRSAGVANKTIAKMAQKVAISFEETKALFPLGKVVVTGNPIRKKVLQPGAKQPQWFTPSARKPILYITGGSQGAKFINLLVKEVLEDILKSWIVIHQCGAPIHEMNYKRELELKRQTLPLTVQENYFVREWVSEDELRWIYEEATAIISRAGANTVQEIIFAAKPALFIPLPKSHEDEQYKNALAVVDAGSAVMMSQEHATSITFLANLEELYAKRQKLRKNAEEYRQRFSLNADEKLYDVVQSVATA